MESILLSLCSFFFAVLLAELLVPVFNSISGKELSIPYLSYWFIPTILASSLLIGLLAGAYPAFFLSAFQPVKVLKGKLATGSGSKTIRSTLVVFQFVASIVLIIGTMIVFQQMRFIQNKNIGYNKEQLIVLDDTWVLKNKTYTFKNEILNHPEITHATVTSFLPVENTNRNNTVFWEEGKLDKDHQILLQRWEVDHDYVQTMGMKIISGRDFDRQFATDSQAVILNQTGARNFGYDENSILNKRISVYEDFDQKGQPISGTYHVIGVVEDFHFESLKENITGLCLKIGSETGMITFRTKSENVETALEVLRSKWAEYAPDQPFDHSFVDERFAAMYASTLQVRNIFGSFALLAIFVACLGLFALASFMADQRLKEIGIRKVLGASVSDIVLLLSRHFAMLVLIAWVIASIIAWLWMDNWLSEFTYRVTLTPWVFVIAGIIALGIALVTVSSQSFKAAVSNPINSLKDE